MRHLWFADGKAVGDFVAANVDGCDRGWENCVGLGIFGDGWTAGVVYHDWNPEAGTICMSAFSESPKWLTREILWEVFDYPFQRAGCQMVIMQVSERNTRMLSILKRFGFDMVRIPRGRGRDEDEIICTLTDDQWRASPLWRRPDGKAERTEAA